MNEKQTLNKYRELSISLTMCNMQLKELNRNLVRIKSPGKHRNILLHEKLEVKKMINCIKYSIRKLADNLDFAVVEMAW